MTLEELVEKYGLTRDEERRIEISGLFMSRGVEGCDRFFLSPQWHNKLARIEAKKFGWCVMCFRLRSATGRSKCALCIKRTADQQRSPSGRASHLEALRKSNAKIRERLEHLGICTSCRKRPARPNRVGCQQCKDDADRRRHEKREQLRKQTGVIS